MEISQLLQIIDADILCAESAQKLDRTFEIKGFETDSRKVKAGSVFIALSGHLSDGHDFVNQAFERGAILCLTEREIAATGATIQVANLRDKVGPLASAFHNHPTENLHVIGITGTNGKTTTAYIVYSILQKLGLNPTLIGTVETIINGESHKSVNTTPGAIELQQIAADTVIAGGRAIVMEVSSHGLEQGRVAGIDFSAAIFTNLSQDHLDYHKTFTAYRAAKGLLFSGLKSDATAILNGLDPVSDFYQTLTDATIVRYGVCNGSRATGDLSAEVIQKTLQGCEVMIRFHGERVRARVPFVGDHNIQNCLAAIAACQSLGFELSEIVSHLETCEGVPGRLERVSDSSEPAIFVDYAHTDDALDNVLKTLRPLTRGRLSVVFGCGGDRDQGKRPKMGAAAARWADQLVVTSDNPRSEEPSAIVKQILAGVKTTQCHVEIDRAAAIKWAIENARKNDVVVIAGKGHESTQTFADKTIEFCDRKISREVLTELYRTGAN